MLMPLGDRVLIKPDPPPETTDSGLHLVRAWKPENTGVIVGVGTPRHPLKDEADDMAEMLEYIHRAFYLERDEDGPKDAAALLRRLVQREPTVKVGDVVVFSWSVGQELIVDGERFLLMREDDLLCVLEGVAA